MEYFLLKGGPSASQRLFLLAGEHARELVASEVAFAFLKAICGDQEASVGTRAAAVREKIDVMAVLSVSSIAREAVERVSKTW